MTDWATASERLETHIRGVQIGGSNVFKSADVRTDTGQVDRVPEGHTSCMIRWSRRDISVAHGNELEVFDVEVEIRLRAQPTPDGGGVLRDWQGQSRLASISKAVRAACFHLDASSTPAITPYIRYVGQGDAPPDSGGNNEHVLSLQFEALLEA